MGQSNKMCESDQETKAPKKKGPSSIITGIKLRGDQLDRLTAAGCRIKALKNGKAMVYDQEGTPIYNINLPAHTPVASKGKWCSVDIRKRYEDGSGKIHWSPIVHRLTWVPMSTESYGKVIGFSIIDTTIQCT